MIFSNSFKLLSRNRLKSALAFLATAFLLSLPQTGFTGPISAHEYKVGPLTIIHPWSRATPAGAKVGGGYLVIRNNGQEDDRLVAVSAEISDKPEIHEMAIKDNVMQMRMLGDGLAIPAGGEVVLKPGSYHLMFMELKRQLTEGETFKGTLAFEKAGKVDVIFNVESVAAGRPATGVPANHDMLQKH